MTKTILLTSFALLQTFHMGLEELKPLLADLPDFPPSIEEDVTPESYFELPLSGATGYAMLETNLRAEPDHRAESQYSLALGEAFCIIEEEGDWWRVSVGEAEGWLCHESAMVNIPDLIPSIICHNANAYSSAFLSMGHELPHISGEKLYDVTCYNPRLGEDSFTMPMLYTSVKKVAQAQAMALAEGNSLILVEAFRPYDTQMAVVESMMVLLEEQPHIEEALSTWGLDFFIATGVSSHQQGIALDVSLAKVLATEERISGGVVYQVVTDYEEYAMPTPIHELCLDAASMAYPISIRGDWRAVPVGETMNQWSILLQTYCTDAGFSPLASEWWHFNDMTVEHYYTYQGKFFLGDIASQAPSVSG